MSKILVYHCFKNHETTRPMSMDIAAIIECPECHEKTYLLGSRETEVEIDDNATAIKRSPWYRALCPLCGGNREVNGLPCACTMEVKHL